MGRWTVRGIRHKSLTRKGDKSGQKARVARRVLYGIQLAGSSAGDRGTVVGDRTMRTKHTPGPWEKQQALVEHCQNGIIHTPRGNYVIAWDSTASVCTDEHDANARLIAAAPEMLAACDEADTAFAVINISDGLTPQARSALRRAWAEVNRVMALATGTADKFKAANPD